MGHILIGLLLVIVRLDGFLEVNALFNLLSERVTLILSVRNVCMDLWRWLLTSHILVTSLMHALRTLSFISNALVVLILTIRVVFSSILIDNFMSLYLIIIQSRINVLVVCDSLLNYKLLLVRLNILFPLISLFIVRNLVVYNHFLMVCCFSIVLRKLPLILMFKTLVFNLYLTILGIATVPKLSWMWNT